MTAAFPPETLILTRAEIGRLMQPADWLEAVETGFRAAAAGEAASPPPMALDGSGGTFHAKGATIQLGRHYAALKLNGNFPDNPSATGLPTIQGAVLLCDGETGALLAVMDSIEVTLRRTAPRPLWQPGTWRGRAPARSWCAAAAIRARRSSLPCAKCCR